MLHFVSASAPQENEYTKKDSRSLIESYIVSISQKDTEALASLYEETKTVVYGFALSILKNTHDAEDVLQETYIRIYDYAHTYKPSGNPMAWILQISKNLSLMLLRKKNRENSTEESEKDLLISDDFSSGIAEQLSVTDAMLKLTESERQIITLHAVSDLKHREIAKLLGLPLPTVLSKYRRSIKKLQKMLEE